MEAQLSHL